MPAVRYIEALPEHGEATLFFLGYATEIATIFNGPPRRWNLFKENPRGALQKRNTSIWKTLKGPGRSRFHALNNGLSIVCDDYSINPIANSVLLDGMRIVNGCQTTVTIAEAAAPTKGPALIDDSVLLPIRVTKTTSVDYRRSVSEATNTQKQVTAADMASLQDEMRQYQELFGLLDPSFFFEIQAGNWDYMMSKDEKTQYASRIEREPLAQSVMAFKGMPGEALEDRRYIFTRSTGDSKGWYDQVFASGVSVEQMLLSWSLLARVHSKLEAADANSDDPLNKTEYTRYSSLVRLWLVAELIARHTGLSFGSQNLPPKIAISLTKNIDDWFDHLYEPVNEAVFHAIRELFNAFPDVEPRNFFRLSHREVKKPGPPPVARVPNNVFREQLGVTSARSATKDAIASALSASTTP